MEEKGRKAKTVLICCRSKVSEARAARAKSRGFLISLAVTLDGINEWQKELGQSCARALHGGGELLSVTSYSASTFRQPSFSQSFCASSSFKPCFNIMLL